MFLKYFNLTLEIIEIKVKNEKKAGISEFKRK